MEVDRERIEKEMERDRREREERGREEKKEEGERGVERQVKTDIEERCLMNGEHRGVGRRGGKK